MLKWCDGNPFKRFMHVVVWVHLKIDVDAVYPDIFHFLLSENVYCLDLSDFLLMEVILCQENSFAWGKYTTTFKVCSNHSNVKPDADSECNINNNYTARATGVLYFMGTYWSRRLESCVDRQVWSVCACVCSYECPSVCVFISVLFYVFSHFTNISLQDFIKLTNCFTLYKRHQFMTISLLIFLLFTEITEICRFLTSIIGFIVFWIS